MCRGLIGRMGKCREYDHGLADIGYDPMIYTLTFEDDRCWEDGNNFSFRSFSRLGCGRLRKGRFQFKGLVDRMEAIVLGYVPAGSSLVL